MTDDPSYPAELPSNRDVSIDKQRLGKVYARALLGATERRQTSEGVLEELDALVEEVLGRHPQLELALASPRFSPTDKAGLLDRVFAGRVSDDLLTFLKVVGQHGRLDCIRQIQRAAREELNRLRHRVAVHVTTAEPLNDELSQRILDQLQHKLGCQVDLRCQVNSALLGGLVVRVGDTVFDASVANRLARLKEDIIHKTSLAFRESADRFAVSS
jgi:F-type H+-transporting ATPase subunit delta